MLDVAECEKKLHADSAVHVGATNNAHEQIAMKLHVDATNYVCELQQTTLRKNWSMQIHMQQ
jgi:hypothetical protein